MKKTLKICGIVAAVLGFIFTALTIVSLVLTILECNNTSDVFQMITKIIPQIIAIPFAALEFKDGIDLIKIAKQDKVDKLIRPIAQLSVSVLGSITAGALSAFALLIYSSIDSLGSINFGENIQVFIGLFIILIGFLLTNIFKTNAYLPLSIAALSYGVIGMAYAFINNYIESTSIVETIANVINLIILLLVLVFSILFIIYYAKHKAELDREYDRELDYDVIKKYKNDIAKIKVYQVRYGKGGKITKALLLLGCIFFAMFSVTALVEGFVALNKTEFNFANFSVGSAGSIIDTLNLYSIAIVIPYLIVVIYSLIRNNSTLYSYLVAFISRCVYFLMLAISMITSFIGNNTMYLIIQSITSGVLFVASMIIGLFAKNYYQKMADGLKKGDSFLSVSEYASKSAILYCVFSGIFTLPYILGCILKGRAPSISVFFFLASIVLLTIGIVRNKKHNMEESFVTFHNLKVVPTNEESTNLETSECKESTDNKPNENENANDSNKKSKVIKIIKFAVILIVVVVAIILMLTRKK